MEGLNVFILNKPPEESMLEKVLKHREEKERHSQFMMAMEGVLSRLDRIPRTGTIHSGGG